MSAPASGSDPATVTDVFKVTKVLVESVSLAHARMSDADATQRQIFESVMGLCSAVEALAGRLRTLEALAVATAKTADRQG